MPEWPESSPDTGDLERIDPALHADLTALGARVAFPATPDLAGAVGRRIAAAPPVPSRCTWPRRPVETADRRSWWRVAAAGAAVSVILVAGAVIPAARQTVADWFGVPGIRIVFDDTAAPPSVAGSATAVVGTPPLSLGLLLGEPVTLEEARSRAGFPVAVPDLPEFGPPDEIYLRDRPGAAEVAFLYRPRPGLPATAGTGIGLLLVQFEAGDDAFWGVKTVGNATETRAVRIGDREALWLGGAHRLLVPPDPGDASGGTPRPGAAETRRTGNVLLWAENGVTYRLESSLSLAETLRIAEATQSSGIGSPAP